MDEGWLVCLQGVGMFVVELKGQFVLFEVCSIVEEIVVCCYQYCCEVFMLECVQVNVIQVSVFNVNESDVIFYFIMVYYENDLLV